MLRVKKPRTQVVASPQNHKSQKRPIGQANMAKLSEHSLSILRMYITNDETGDFCGFVSYKSS